MVNKIKEVVFRVDIRASERGNDSLLALEEFDTIEKAEMFCKRATCSLADRNSRIGVVGAVIAVEKLEGGFENCKTMFVYLNGAKV